jgi:hypothetical protein
MQRYVYKSRTSQLYFHLALFCNRNPELSDNENQRFRLGRARGSIMINQIPESGWLSMHWAILSGLVTQLGYETLDVGRGF